MPEVIVKYIEESELKNLWNSFAEDFAGEGYCWISDKPYGKIIKRENSSEIPCLWEGLFDKENNKKEYKAFLHEAYLFDKERKISLFIKQLDTRWMCREIQLKASLESLKAQKGYLEKRYPRAYGLKDSGIDFLEFLEYWEPVKDEFCENMEVLKPAWSTFIGFISKTGGSK